MPGEAALRTAGLTIEGLRRAAPDSADAWDRGWIEAVARVEAPGAVVELRGPWLRGVELAAFAKAVAVLHRDLRGSAHLDCLEPGLDVTLRAGTLGQVTMHVAITPDHLTQSHSFIFAPDQSDLPALLDSLRAMVRHFPPISPR